mgnify:CR=1 FL=1
MLAFADPLQVRDAAWVLPYGHQLITTDCGGSNGPRVRPRRLQVQPLADELVWSLAARPPTKPFE